MHVIGTELSYLYGQITVVTLTSRKYSVYFLTRTLSFTILGESKAQADADRLFCSDRKYNQSRRRLQFSAANNVVTHCLELLVAKDLFFTPQFDCWISIYLPVQINQRRTGLVVAEN